MDTETFDGWTRRRAAATNRRRLLGWSLTTGIAGLLSRARPASAQFGGGGSCAYTITLTSSTTGGETVSGNLVVDIGTDGAIDTGSLTLTGQAAASVVGQATGAAIELLVSLADGTTLFLSGVAASPVNPCSSAILGALSNSDSDQLGTWQAQSVASTVTTAPTSTPTPLSQSGNSTGQGSGSSSAGQSQPPGSCEAPKMLCGSACCPAGSTCLDTATGACECPTGTEECGIACFPSCEDRTPLDPVTCLCPTG